MGLFDGFTNFVGDLLGYGPKKGGDSLSFNASASAIDALTNTTPVKAPPMGGQVPTVKEYFGASGNLPVSPINPGVGSLQINPSTYSGNTINQPRPITPSTGQLTVPQNYIGSSQAVQQSSYQPADIPRQPVQTIYNTNPTAMAVQGQTGTSGTPAQSFMGGGSGGATGGTPGIIGGSSNRTGLLGGVGTYGGGSPAVATDQQQTEEQKKKNQLQPPQQQNTGNNLPPMGSYGAAGSPAQPDGRGGFVLSNGQSSLAPATYSGTPSGTPTPSFTVQTPNGPIDASTVLESSRKDVQALLSGGKITSETAEEFYAKIDNYKTQLHQLELQQNPLQANPHVQDTYDQSLFLSQFGPQEKQSFQAQMDAYRTQIGLPQIESDIFNKTAEINSTVKAYQEIIKDIKDNPELPKGLAARRISEFTNKNGIMLQNLNAELQNLTQKRSFANEQLNQQFQIVQAEESRISRNRSDARTLLDTYISSGAIAQFNDETLSAVSLATGIGKDALNAIKSATVAKTKQYAQFSTETNGAGDLTVYGIKPDGTVDTLKTLKGAGKPTAASVANSSGLTPAQTQNFLRITDNYQKDPIIVNADKAFSANAIADQVIANPQDPGNQLKALYTLVKNLDPDSAVREGELALAQTTQSYFQKFQTSIQRVSKGQVISPAAAVELATATKELASIWVQSAKQREQKYSSQASVSGLQGAWNEYKGGFQQPQNQQPTTVKIGGKDVSVGATIVNSKGQKAKVNADGTVTPL